MASLLEKLILQVKIIFYTFLYFLLYPPIFLLLTPIFIFRLFAALLARIFRRDLSHLVHPRSSVLSCDDFSSNPRWNLVIWLTQEGVMNLSEFREDFYRNFVQARDSKGRLRYPEYQQHWTNFLGFQFWRWEDRFNIAEHIREYDGIYKNHAVVDEKLLLQIVKELTWKPWRSDKSPWEFLQIPNYKMEDDPTPNVQKSILLIRFHHGFGDGFYILKVFLQDICKIRLEDRLGIPKYPKRNSLVQLFLNLLLCIVGPYDIMKMVTPAFDRNAWRIPEKEMKKPMNLALTKGINLDLIKEVKNGHGVGFSSVINAALAGAIRRVMQGQGLPVPKHVSAGVPVPIPNHPDKLRNHFIFAFLPLPTGVADPLKRLRKSHEAILSLKRSTAPLLNFRSVPWVGRVFPWMIRLAFKNRHSTCLLSNFPGAPTAGWINGCKVIDMMFGAGLGPGKVGLGFTLISHTDRIRLLTAADPNILGTDEEVEEFNAAFIQEIKLLRELTPLQQGIHV